MKTELRREFLCQVAGHFCCRSAVVDTKWKNLWPLLQSHWAMAYAFSPEPKIKALVKNSKKMPLLVPLGMSFDFCTPSSTFSSPESIVSIIQGPLCLIHQFYSSFGRWVRR